MLFSIIYIFLSCSLPFKRDLSSFCAIAQLALTIGFVRYPRATGCSASVSLLYAVFHPQVLSIRLGREDSLLYWLFHPCHPLFYTVRSADETVTYAMQFYGRPYTCKRKLSIIGQLFSFQTVVARADYVKQFSGLARIRLTENWEERKRALPLKCPPRDAAWAFIASMRLSGPWHSTRL